MRIYEAKFRGAKLLGVINEGRIVIPIAPICDAMSIDVRGQRERIQRDPVLSKGGRIIRLPSLGGRQNTLCLPINRIHYWLAGVDSGRIKQDDIRALVIAFQEECADVLFAHFMPDFAAALGIETHSLEVRLLSEDLFDREPPQLEATVTTTQIAPIPAIDQEWARRIDVQEIKEALGQQLARVFLELYQAIVDHSSIPRRGAPAENIAIYDRVIIECYAGCSPIEWPEKVRIIDDDGNHLDNYAIDHVTGNKSKNGLFEMMPMTKYWNQRFENKGSKERWEPVNKDKFETFFRYVAYYTGQPSLMFHQDAAE